MLQRFKVAKYRDWVSLNLGKHGTALPNTEIPWDGNLPHGMDNCF